MYPGASYEIKIGSNTNKLARLQLLRIGMKNSKTQVDVTGLVWVGNSTGEAFSGSLCLSRVSSLWTKVVIGRNIG